VLVVVLLFPPRGAWATTLFNTFTYQGELKQNGNAVNGVADIRFSLFDAPTDGTQINGIFQNQMLTVSNGIFTSNEMNFGFTALAGQERWLQIEVRFPTGAGSFTTLSPRQRISPTPYALYAIRAGQATSLTLPYAGSDFGSTAPFAVTAFVDNAAALSGIAPTGQGVEGSGTIGVKGTGNQSGVHGILAQPTSGGAGVLGEVTSSLSHSSGVKGLNPLAGGKGVFGHATNPNSFNIGVYGQADGTDGYGAFGYAGHPTGQTYGGYFEVESTAGTGVKSWANAATGDTSGVYGISLSSSGIGVRGSAGSGTGNTVGVQGECFSPTGVAVYGEASAINTTGDNAGVKGRSFSTTGYGVAGYVSAATGQQFGVAGAGVYGQSDTPGGSRGVYGRVTAETGQNFAVFGEALTSNNWAGYFAGRCHISDNLGLGVTAPAFRLHLSTNSAAKPTSNVWTITSDARLKKNINTISHALDDLMSLRGVTYQWIDPEDQGDMCGTYTGMIAQDVEKVFPEWITTGPDGYKRLTVIGFEGIVVEALRDLRAEKDAQIDHLTSENADLRTRIEALEGLMRQVIASQAERSR
jgi:hypothetical protein